MTPANNGQIGGNHYQIDGPQHWDIITETMGVSYLIGCATKYLFRYEKKNGLEDLKKAKHYVTRLKEACLSSREVPCCFPMLAWSYLQKHSEATGMNPLAYNACRLLFSVNQPGFQFSDLDDALSLIDELIRDYTNHLLDLERMEGHE